MTQYAIIKKLTGPEKAEVEVLRGTACGDDCGSCEVCHYASKIRVEARNAIGAAVGDKVELEAICVVDGAKVEADPAKAAATKVTAIILEQFKGEKQLVFKFKKRKNYKKLRGHRQQLTRVQIESVGSAKAEKPAVKKAAKKDDAEKKPAPAKAADKPASEDAE